MAWLPTRQDVQRFGAGLTYIYALRIPIVVWSGCVALPWIALRRSGFGQTLLRGLFDIAERDASFLQNFQRFMYVTLAALMIAAAIAVIARLILEDGAERLGITPPLIWSNGYELAVRFVAAFVAINLIGGVWVQSVADAGFWAAFTGSIGGLGIFFLVMVWVHPRLWRRVFYPQPVAPGQTGGLPEMLVGAVVSVSHLLLVVLFAIVRRSPAGFVRAVDAQNYRLKTRHAFAFFQFVMSLGLYLGILWAKEYSFGEAPSVPTLCLAIVVLMLTLWALSFITFLVDRHRVPLLTLLAAYGLLMAVFPQGDHFFRSVKAGASRTQPTAADVLAARAGRRVIVVAATGGGIQAAAWTARVLAGLHEDAILWQTDFDDAFLMISAVSGGSVGAMYIVDSYTNGVMLTNDKKTTPKGNHEAVMAAEASSLDEIAWGLTYPDLLWTVAPFFKGLWLNPPRVFNGNNLTVDRGTALEDAWKRTQTLATTALDGWRAEFSGGQRQRPAVIFNATIAETGERMLLGTTQIVPPKTTGRRDVADEYQDVDVPVTTAARLSATFPYVSPPARILRHGVYEDEFHLVDGGYYDNYGTATLLEWLDQGLRTPSEKLPSCVMVLQIRSSPSAGAATPPGARGWWFETAHPINTLFAVRGAGQLSHSDVDMHLVETEDYRIPVVSEVIEFPGRLDGDDRDIAPPLSWHLTGDERRRLRNAWNQTGRARQRIQQFLNYTDVGRCSE